MPHSESPEPVTAIPLIPFKPAVPTKEELPWADLLTLDLEEFDKGPEARQRLAELFLESVHTTGFLYVVNHGVSPKAVNRQADIANTLLESTEEEKKPFYTTPEQAKVGKFSGFKTPELSAAYSLHSTLDYYNFPRLHNDICDEMDDHIPAILKQHLEETKDVTMHLHKVVFRKLLILLAIALKVPLHTYANLHIWEAKSDSYFRFVKYDPRTEEDNAKYQDLFLPGHTDSGSLTFLFNQPSAGLQILDPQGQWKYVQYVEGSLIVNVGEALSHLTGGYLKPTIHRVVKPPKDQEKNRRISLIYFARCFNTCPLTPPESPVLKELGYQDPTETMTMLQFGVARYGGYKRTNYDSDKKGRAPLGSYDQSANKAK